MGKYWKSDITNSTGKYCTSSAIKELSTNPGAVEPSFTIDRYDNELPSLFKLFMSFYTDPTEITFVNEVFNGDYRHWTAFKNSKLFKPYYDQWREEADLRLLSDSIRGIQTLANTEGKSQLPALKYLADRGYNRTEEESKRGRPSKAEKEKVIKEISEREEESRAILFDIKSKKVINES